MAPSSVDKMVEAAVWLLVQGDRAGAEALLAQALRQDPTHERARQAMRSVGPATSPSGQAPAPPLPSRTVPGTPPRAPDLTSTPLEPLPALPRRDEVTARASRAEFEATARTSRAEFEVTARASRAEFEAVARRSAQADDAQDREAVRGAIRSRRGADPMRSTDIEALLGAPQRGPVPEAAELEAPAPAGKDTLLFHSTAMDLTPERALNDLPHIEFTSRQVERRTDPNLAPVQEASTGRSATQPRLSVTSAFAATPIHGVNVGALAAREWVLEVVAGPQLGTELPVSRKTVVLGRGLGALGLDDDPFVSPAHASFFLRGPDLFVSDGGSVSGTWHTIGGVARLSPGESFSAGRQRFRFLGALGAAPKVEPAEYGAPVPGASWRLEHTLVGLRPGRAWLLRGIVTVGRGKQGLTFADDDSMAAHHVDLRPAGQELELVDHSSGPGTWVCVPPGGERRVPAGTLVRVGTTVLRVTLR